MSWIYGTLYIIFFWCIGVCLSCLPCIACFRRHPFRSAPRKWIISCFGVSLAWVAPSIVWFAYSPLNVCTARWTYSSPRKAYQTSDSYWEPFWCSRKCESQIYHPKSLQELQTFVSETSRIRAVGGGHSSTDLQCNEGGTLVVIQDYFCHYRFDPSTNISTFGAGCTVENALKFLLEKGRQLRGFGGIAQQRLGGAISTSLHGQHTTSFATYVTGLQAVLSNGTLVEITSEPMLNAWRGSMGRLGILVEVSVQTWPIEFVKCVTMSHVAFPIFQTALARSNVMGFEAKRLIRHDQRDDYTVRTCELVVREETDDAAGRVPYEDKNGALEGFLVDNVALPMVTLFGSTLSRSPWISNWLIDISSVATSRPGVVPSVNDFRVPVSFNPHFDEEYTIPASRCHSFLEDIGRTFPKLNVHAFVRRVDADSGWLSWAPVDSCAVRLEYFDYNRVDFVRYERIFRLQVERLVLAYNGSGHRGKIWYRSGARLLDNSPNRDAFETYRESIDPTSKFDNEFTREMKGEDERTHEILPHELETRAFIYRFLVWTAVAVNVGTILFLLLLCGRKIIVVNLENLKQESISNSNMENGKRIRPPVTGVGLGRPRGSGR